MIELTAGKDDDGRRLDRIIRKALPDLSLSLIHRLFRQKKVLVNGQISGPDTRIQQGMIIRINAYVNHNNNRVNDIYVNYITERVNIKKPPVNIPLNLPPILWHGSGIIVFNKPQGLSTHGPNSLDTLFNTWLDGTLPRSLSFKPGPLNRLDKPTSGIIVFSENIEGARFFSDLLRKRKLEKTYLAIVEGRIDKDEAWHDVLTRDVNLGKTYVNTPCDPQAAKEAITTVKPLASNGEYSLIEAKIKTGRRHQIRAQAAFHGHHLAGDIKYGAKPQKQLPGGGFFLHAWKLKFNREDIPEGFPGLITAPLPEAFQAQIEALFGKRGLRSAAETV
jgi:23S rRNA pseudouridine955/2504/2580 synthase